MSEYRPAIEMERRLVELFRADSVLTHATTGLLYPEWARRIDAADVRVYRADVEWPENRPDLREAMPRIHFSAIDFASKWEQPSEDLDGPVAVETHVVVPASRGLTGERIDAYLASVIPVTWLSNARIIAAQLVDEGVRREERIPALNNARVLITRYKSENVGVLA